MTALPEYLDTHCAVVGSSGAGKTVTAKVQVEAMLDAGRHICIIDPTGAWYGLRSTADGERPAFDIPIFGGSHGDVAVTADQGEAVGRIVAGGVSAIIDVSMLRTGAEQRRFVRDLLRALRAKPDGNFHLIVDEADEFAAQKPRDDYGFQSGEELIWMAKRGRLAGFVLTIITQRPASIDKEVLSQAQTLIVHQLVAPVDQKPVVDYLRDHADSATLKQIKGSLAGLDRGERWIYSPRLGVLERGTSPMPETFDSSRTPEAGEQVVQPKMLASIDLGAIREALAVEDDEPKQPYSDAVENSEMIALRKKVADRDAEIARLKTRLAEVEPIAEAVLAERKAWQDLAENVKRQLELGATQMQTALSNLKAPKFPVLPDGTTSPAGNPNTGGNVVESSAERATTNSHSDRKERRPANSDAKGRRSDAGMNSSALKMLDMLERIAPARVTWTSLAAMIGNKARGGNFNAARKGLRESGRILEEGDTVRAAKLGVEGLSREQARALWKDVLSNPAPQMIDALDVKPMPRDQLGPFIGIAARGGHFNNGVAQLVRNGVAVDRGGVLHLADPLPGERG